MEEFMTHTSRIKVITGVALCLGICVIAIPRWFVAPPRNGTIKPTSGNAPYARLKTSQVNDASSGRSAVSVIPRQQLQVVDAETGVGLAEAKVRAVYFYAGGRGEPHELSTDGSGNVAIPEPSEAADRFANIFVSAEGHVPKCLSWGRRDAAQYTMKLDRALSVGGVIINQQGQAVEDVKIRVQGPGVQDGASENIDFQTSEVTSDAGGRWLCSYIPRDWSEIRFILTHPQYAVTLPIVRVGKVDLTKLVLVIDCGHTVTGRVLDIAGQPIAGATIKELNNTGYRRQSTETDADGTFTVAAGIGIWPSIAKGRGKAYQ